MKKIDELMKDINEISQIPFILKDELGDIYVSPSFNAKGTVIEKKIQVLNRDLFILLNKDDEKVIPLLTYYISNVIKEYNYKKDRIIKDLLSSKNVDKEDIKDFNSRLLERFDLITIYTEGDIEEAYSLLREGYEEDDTIVLVYQDKILVLGLLEDVLQHAESINETLASNISGKVLISYTSVKDYTEISEALKKCSEKIILAKRFNLETHILSEKDVFFEEIIESISENKKKELINKFNDGFRNIDREMIKTIDMFFKCGLNLSEASKELYIHRNTLIYRIEKIEKYTGFDIRDFNTAVIFKTIYILWKEENKII